MDNRRVILAVILSVAVLVAWQYFFAPPPPKPAPPVESAADAPAASAQQDAAAGAEAQTAEAADAGGDDEAPPEEEPVAADRAQNVVVETPVYRAELSNRGAELVSFVLKEHESRGGGPVDLVRARAEGPYPYAVVAEDGSPTPLADALFAVERAATADGERVAFRYAGPLGSARKTFSFHPDGSFDFEAEVPRPRRWRLYLGPGLRNPSFGEEKSRFERPAAIYATPGGAEVLSARKAQVPVVVPGGGLDFVALEDTYFLAAVVPRGDTLAEVRVEPLLQEAVADAQVPQGAPPPVRFRPVPPEDDLTDLDKELLREYSLLLAPRGSRLDVLSYWGAKKYDHLADELPGHLERTVSLGVFGFLARWILALLLWIHDHVVHNYGWSIVLVTLLIKVLLLPLTHKSYVSMRKMQEINPQMQAIRARWRGKLRDKQGRMDLEAQRKMNEEMQQLYREAGVNPVGGCLPMLLQLPVLYAFYNLLYSAVELRGAPWILWITDLTQPFWPLAVVMGATQFIQQRMTPMAGDPMQRRLMQFMPIVFTIFFLGFPSGLVLYWLTNNVLTIVQQGAYNRWKELQANKAPADGSAKKADAHKGSKTSRRMAAK